MSLHALSRYDDAEDEILDEDHNLVLEMKDEPSPPQSAHSSRPPSNVGKTKTSLVSYIGNYSDDEDNDDDDESSSENEDNDTPSKGSVINLGLYDGNVVLSSTGSASPSSTNDNTDTVAQGKENCNAAHLPPEPDGRCSKSLQEKIAALIEKKNNGMNVNEYVQKKKEFRNPSIYEKLVTFVGIDEHGTNFPKHLYDPSIWGPESYYDALAKLQKEHHDKKEKEKLKEKRAQVEFVIGTKKNVSQVAAASSTVVPTAEKKSKWDQKVPPSVQAAIKSNLEKG